MTFANDQKNRVSQRNTHNHIVMMVTDVSLQLRFKIALACTLRSIICQDPEVIAYNNWHAIGSGEMA
jgi:hypothetical protein